jgi:hypothetical protein
MTESVAQVTIATSSGALWLALIIHFGAGLLALSSGFVAIVAAKGGRTHRRAGRLFVIAMIVLGIFAAGIALDEHKVSSVIGGIFTAYLVSTAFTTVRPLAGPYAHAVNVAVTLLGSFLALIQLKPIALALSTPTRVTNGVPALMIAFIGTVTVLASIGDWRLLRAGSITGVRRLVRHLWRMCFGLFIASGSFFLGQMKFLPEPMRIVPLLGALGIAPLLVLLYWMWRVRRRNGLRSVVLRTPLPTSAQ